MVNKEVQDKLAAFVAERDWEQFHTQENLAKSVAIEAGELLECFQWSAEPDPKRVQEELADVLTYCLLLSAKIGLDPDKIVLDKLEITKKKYPLDFSRDAVSTWRADDERHSNWPIVYVLDDGRRARSNQLRDIYVGESLNAAGRLRQHLDTPAKQHLKNIHVIFDERFNKSACLDLESYLIKMLAGDGANRVLNRNNGITESKYFQREMYRESFPYIFQRLRALGVFTRGSHEIENSDLFKLSPFKALTADQAASIEEIVMGLLADLESGADSTIVIQGDPGTGKTVAAIYLMKLIVDLQTFTTLEDLDSDARFASFFTDTNRMLLQGLRVGLVVPQQSLRSSIKAVFKKTPGLHPSMVMTPFEIGEADGMSSLLLVDETHRLSQRANQPSGVLNAKFSAITRALYEGDDFGKTQLDWIRTKSRHQIFLLDAAQSVRPADLPSEVLSDLVADARASRRHFQLQTQMRVRAGSDFVSYVRWILDPRPLSLPRVRRDFGDYDFRTFDNVARMRDEIFQRDAEVGLARIVAGYAWEWRSKRDKTAFDIMIGDAQLRWNSTPTDWISSNNALEEVGSIHTVQGYDLNYVGVIIGLDLRFDTVRKRLWVDRKSYFDKKGKENNPALGRTYSDDDLLRFITQIYAVLMTRGIRGTSELNDPGFMRPIEDLFLDISIHEVLTQTMVTFVEPWKTMYINSIREQRYGDAIWARYCIEGGVENGVILGQGPNPDITVLDQIREDAVEAKENEPGLFADALELYRQASSEDGHPEVIKIIFDTDGMEAQD
ncbi:hypothetical protein FAVG1_07631 [Fusarium avenaceum]|nr:hypothetical protein FAVG1_07631 [Fusarium avenaceum]